MRNFRRGPDRTLRFLLIAATFCLISAKALAVPITDYITVQPIDVCSGAAGTTIGCAPINSTNQNYKTAPVGAIGSIVSGINVTRAIWNQIGLDITYMPAVQDPNAGSFLTLSVDPNSNPLTSTPFKTLSDQDGISHGQPPLPVPPLSQNPSTINMFFVNKLTPITPPGGPLYGFSWIDNNGVAIAASALVGLGARPDTIAHELGHNFGLDHTTFGAGPDPSGACGAACLANLMTAGGLRALSTTTNVLTNLKAGTADQLNALQAAQVLDPTGFLNPIPAVSARVTAWDDAPFHVSFDQPGRPGEFLSKLTLTAPEGVTFLSDTFQVSSTTPSLDGKVTGTVPSCGVARGCRGSTLELDFARGAFVDGQSLSYDVTVCKQEGYKQVCQVRPDLALEGGTYTYQFETDNADGVAVEQFETTGDLVDSGGDIEDLLSDSQLPDDAIPSEILNPDTFVGFSTQPCALGGSCPPLLLADADPAEDSPAVPEPPSILILAAALLGFPVACRAWGPAGRYSKPALRSPSRM